ncbi:MAG TPA: hypothetical protein VGF45_19830, partial [Polyangia bacterium]
MAAPGNNDEGRGSLGQHDNDKTDDSAAARAAANEAPPFFTWGKIFGFVAAVLAVQVVIYT